MAVPLWMIAMGSERLLLDMNRLFTLLFHQGVLDEQFVRVQQLQDEESPNIVAEVLTLYFHASERRIRNLRKLLIGMGPMDYKRMEILLNQQIGSSSSIGANRVRNVCIAFLAAYEQFNRPGCLRALEMLKHEYCYFKNKMYELFQLEQQIMLATGVRYIPIVQPPQQNQAN